MSRVRSEHGTRSRYQAGCRCDDCRRAASAAATEYRHRTGRTDPARWVPPSHGRSRYRRGCRCEVCRAANTEQARRRRERRRAVAE